MDRTKPTVIRIWDNIRQIIWNGLTTDILGLKFIGGILVSIGNSIVNGGAFTDDPSASGTPHIVMKRGNFANMPRLLPGEPAWAQDTKTLYVGDLNGTPVMPIASSTGVPIIRKTATLLAQSATGTITTYTNGATDGLFQVGGYLNVTAQTAINVTMQVSYTDESNASRTDTIGSSVTTVSATPTSPITISVKASTVITMLITGSVVSITFNTGVYMVQII